VQLMLYYRVSIMNTDSPSSEESKLVNVEETLLLKHTVNLKNLFNITLTLINTNLALC